MNATSMLKLIKLASSKLPEDSKHNSSELRNVSMEDLLAIEMLEEVGRGLIRL